MSRGHFTSHRKNRNRARRPKIDRPASIPGGTIGTGERRPDRNCANTERSGVTREQLTVLTGYKRSSRDSYLQRLRKHGLIEDSEPITATNEGLELLGPTYEPLPTGDALRTMVSKSARRRVPNSNCPGRSLSRSMMRDELSEQTGYQRSSRDTYLQRLRSRRLIDVQGANVGASEILFD